jgi:hypothetical protein
MRQNQGNSSIPTACVNHGGYCGAGHFGIAQLDTSAGCWMHMNLALSQKKKKREAPHEFPKAE